MQGLDYSFTFYKSGFFGYGEKGDFQQWSLAHFMPIILLAIAVVILYRNRESIRNWKHEEDLRFGIIITMVLVEMGFFWRLLYVGPEDQSIHTLMIKLPLQVCQWALLTNAVMMAKKSKMLFKMDFFLSLSIGILPLLFPAVISKTGPAYFRYYQFWGEHLIPIFGVFYMMFILRREI